MNTKDHAVSGNVSTERALDLALEALEETLKTLDDANAIPGGPIADTIWYSPYETLFDYLEVQIAAIKQARSVPTVQSAERGEPVAWLYKDDWGRTKIAFSKETANEWGTEVQPLYTAPPAAQRPVAEPHKWVGLTDEDVDECYESVMFNPDIEPTRVLVYQTIEAKLKEKNT
jgi:hypothetical protein